MTTFIAFLYGTMAILCITGITLTVSEIQTIWLKYKRNKGMSEMGDKLKLYEVETMEPRIRTYSVQAKSHEEAFENYKTGLVIDDTKDDEYPERVRRVGEVND